MATAANAVTTKALVARINRKLAKTDEQLRKSRVDSRWRNDVGDWYVEDHANNSHSRLWVDPEALGRELGVLGIGEEVCDE